MPGKNSWNKLLAMQNVLTSIEVHPQKIKIKIKIMALRNSLTLRR